MRMMGLFDSEFVTYEGKCDALNLRVRFESEGYPPRVVLTQEQTLFDQDGAAEQRDTEIVIVGGLEQEITVKGTFETTKKQMNDLIRGAADLLEVYLHAYMQDHMEYERAMRGQK